MREIDIMKQNIMCCDDFDITDECVNIPYLLLFDVDRYFGTNTGDDCAWVNLYTFYHIDGNITATYEVTTGNGTETFDWELTEIEQAFFRGMMEGYCNHKCGCTLAQLLMEM